MTDSIKQSELMPVDWPGIEPHWRAGIRSLKSIGKEFGVTAPAILKHFRRRGIARDLKARIVAQAEQKVNAAVVNAQVNKAYVFNEPAIVDANSNVLASVMVDHRKLIFRTRLMAQTLLAELESVSDNPKLFRRVHDALNDPEQPASQALREMTRLLASLPTRSKVLRDIADVVSTVVAMERQAFGLNAAPANDGRPTVIVRDYTGRGDPDSPRALETVERVVP